MSFYTSQLLLPIFTSIKCAVIVNCYDLIFLFTELRHSKLTRWRTLLEMEQQNDSNLCLFLVVL